MELAKRERPILMSAPMALATRNGTKTETRRIMDKVNVDPSRFVLFDVCKDGIAHFDDLMLEDVFAPNFGLRCPYGKIGDVLWIREPYYAYGYWQLVKKKNGKMGYQFVEEKESLPAKFFEYRYTDNPPTEVLTRKDTDSHGWYKRLARFMPKAACRTKVEIVGLKVERLNDITEESAIAEGIEYLGENIFEVKMYKNYVHTDYKTDNAKFSFQTLWQSINGVDSWRENPFVWVVQFKLLDD